MNGKPSSPVLRGLGVSNGARLLDPNRVTSELSLMFQVTRRLPVIREADDSGLSDKILPKMLKTYCSPIEDLLYMGLQ